MKDYLLIDYETLDPKKIKYNKRKFRKSVLSIVAIRQTLQKLTDRGVLEVIAESSQRTPKFRKVIIIVNESNLHEI